MNRVQSIVSEAPVLVRLLALWMGVEVLGVLALPLVVSDVGYMDAFLSEQAEHRMELFLAGEDLLVPDVEVGWVTAPDASLGSWRTDEDGARTTGQGDWNDPTSFRVLAVGSSMMNGGMAVGNDETVTAFLENDSVVTKNFGSMMYGLDQSLIAARRLVDRFAPDAIVVGVDHEPLAALTNVFVPLRAPDQVNVPLVKPRFVLEEEGEPDLIPSDPVTLLAKDSRGELVEHVRTNDAFAWRYERFRWSAYTPVARAVNHARTAVEGVRRRFSPDDRRLDLLDVIVEDFDRLEGLSGTRVVFVVMPPPEHVTRLPWERDFFGDIVTRLQRSGRRVIDGRAALATSGDEAALYLDDGIHLTPLGNRILAEAIRSVL